MTEQVLFCDGVRDATIVNGVVCLEWYTLRPMGPNRENVPVVSAVVAMPLQNIVALLGSLTTCATR